MGATYGISSSLAINPYSMYGDFDPRMTAAIDPYRACWDFGTTFEPSGACAFNELVGLMLLEYLFVLSLMMRGSRDLGQMSSGTFQSGAPSTWSSAPTTSSSAPTGKGTSNDFLQAALSQNGDRYVWGAETRKDDPNPSAFDCSELVEWAGARAGVKIPDGSANQEAWCRQNGTMISVEQALRTPGALLFRKGHVAISLGDGRTIEAKGSKYGVGTFSAAGRFTSAALVPGMTYG